MISNKIIITDKQNKKKQEYILEMQKEIFNKSSYFEKINNKWYLHKNSFLEWLNDKDIIVYYCLNERKLNMSRDKMIQKNNETYIIIDEFLKVLRDSIQLKAEKDQLQEELNRYQDMVSALIDKIPSYELIEILKEFMC